MGRKKEGRTVGQAPHAVKVSFMKWCLDETYELSVMADQEKIVSLGGVSAEG